MSGETIIDAGGLRMIFTRAGDRYSHAIGWTEGSRFVPLLQSVEGTASDDWPPSPPLQSLHLEDGPDGRKLAMLVGMAGRSHWSMSVELEPAGATIACDVACRLHAIPGKLTSTYFLGQTEVTAIDRQRSHFSGRDDLSKRTMVMAAEEGSRIEQKESNRLEIGRQYTAAAFPATARWRYTFRFGDARQQ